MADEQAERIKENYALMMQEAEESGTFPSLDEFEQVFEDRDPFEFL